MILLIIAGLHKYFYEYCHSRNLNPRDHVYVSSSYRLRGYDPDSVSIIVTGTGFMRSELIREAIGMYGSDALSFEILYPGMRGSNE